MSNQSWDEFLSVYCNESKLLKDTNAKFIAPRLCADLDEEFFVKIHLMSGNVQVGVLRDESWYNFKILFDIPSIEELDEILIELVESLKIEEHLFLYEYK